MPTLNDRPNFWSGNDNNNNVSGLGGNDFLFGFGGNDTMLGGDGKDYMLVNSKTGKKLFVDRNGHPDVPLEDRDYSKLSPQEIIAEAKKLQAEADEAIADGRYGDALELAAKAEELLAIERRQAEQRDMLVYYG